MRTKVALASFVLIIFAPSAFATPIEIAASNVKPIELKQIASSARIVALANGSAEIVSALGLRNALVGRDIASTTSELAAIPIVTSGHQVIAEKVISQRPSLVLVDSNTGPKSAIDLIRASKIKVISITEAWNLRDSYTKVDQIASAIGLKQQSKILITQMKESISKSKVSIGWKPKVAFLYLRGTSSIYLMGGPGSGADSLISELGGVDVGAKSLKNPFNTLTSEALIQANPDVFLLMKDGLKSVGGEVGLLKLPGVMQTNAGKQRKILAVDDSLLLSFGPRTPELLSRMAQALKSMK